MNPAIASISIREVTYVMQEDAFKPMFHNWLVENGLEYSRARRTHLDVIEDEYLFFIHGRPEDVSIVTMMKIKFQLSDVVILL